MSARTLQVPKHFSPQYARALPAIGAVLNEVSSRISTLPLHVYEVGRDGAETLVPVTDPEVMLLTRRWSAHGTAIDGIEHLLDSVLVDGYGAVWVERGDDDMPLALHPLDPACVSRARVGGEIDYHISLEGVGRRKVLRDDLIFLAFRRPRDGVTDVSPLAEKWDAIRAALVATKFAGWYFDRGAEPSSIYVRKEGQIGDIEAETKALWKAEDKMRQEGRRSLIAPPGWSPQKMGGNPREAELADQRNYGVQEVSRIYGVPPMLLMDLTNGTYSNFSQARHGLGEVVERWCVKVAAEMSNILWPDGSRIARFDTTHAVREPFGVRMTGYRTAVEAGIATANQLRLLEGWEPVGDIDDEDNPANQLKQVSTPRIEVAQ